MDNAASGSPKPTRSPRKQEQDEPTTEKEDDETLEAQPEDDSVAELEAGGWKFSFLPHLLQVHRFGVPPDRPVCPNLRNGTGCPNGSACRDKHPITSNTSNLICKHWLKGLCKKGDACDFMHEYNIRARADCRQFVATAGYCSQGDDCNYLHPDLDIVDERRRPICEWYERGHCRLGPTCARRHVRKARICPLYMAGFCPAGRQCLQGAHARWRDETVLPKPERRILRRPEDIEAEREKLRIEAEERDLKDWERGDTSRLRGPRKRPYVRPRRGF